MDAIVGAILNYSRLEISLIRINNQEPDSFVMEIEGRVVRTGPVSATMLPMTVDMLGPKGLFGKAQLPEIKTQSSGTFVHVPPQKVDIIDHEAFQAFVKAIQLDKAIVLKLDNGVGKIKAMFMTANINYKKDVDIAGMDGPKIDIVKTEDLGDGKFKNTLKITNPSPLDLEIPDNTFHYIDEDGTVIAEQHGKLPIVRGDSFHEVTGEVKAKNPKGKLRLVGIDVVPENWMKQTIKYFDSVVTLSPELTKMMS